MRKIPVNPETMTILKQLMVKWRCASLSEVIERMASGYEQKKL